MGGVIMSTDGGGEDGGSRVEEGQQRSFRASNCVVVSLFQGESPSKSFVFNVTRYQSVIVLVFNDSEMSSSFYVSGML